METDIERLHILFRRARALPELPGPAMRLAQVIETGDASLGEVERIICTDAGLAVRVLRASNTAKFAAIEPVVTLRGAIMRLGFKSVRSLALSFAIHDVIRIGKTEIDMQRFAFHSVFVGLLARYIFARHDDRGGSSNGLTGDELFALGILHDLHVPLLAQVAPLVLQRVMNYARRQSLTVEAAFDKLYSEPMSSLGAAAAATWKLPDLFLKGIRGMREPWVEEELFTAWSCLAYAEYLAVSHGAATERWPVNSSVPEDVRAEVGLADEEVEPLLDLIGDLTRQYLDESTNTKQVCAA